MARRSSELTLKQEKAIVALLQQPSIEKAAEAAGVGHRSLNRWLGEDELFKKAYRTARRETFAQAVGLTQRYAGLAVTTLAKIMADQDSPASAKVSAATTLLRFAREGIELDDLAARIETLEKVAESESQGGGQWLSRAG